MPKQPKPPVMDEVVAAVSELTTKAEEREKAVENLCESVKQLLGNSENVELEAIHAVGVQLMDAKGQDLYGPKITAEVAKKLSTYKQKIQFAIRFAEAYDDSGFDALKELKTKEDKPYIWTPTHVRFLLRIKDNSERDSVAVSCAQEDWTCRKLQAEVKAVTGEAPAAESASATLSLTKQLESLHNFYNKWNDFVNQQARDGVNVADKIASNQAGVSALTEKQRSMLSLIKSISPGFTENVCKLNAWLEAIDLADANAK